MKIAGLPPPLKEVLLRLWPSSAEDGLAILSGEKPPTEELLTYYTHPSLPTLSRSLPEVETILFLFRNGQTNEGIRQLEPLLSIINLDAKISIPLVLAYLASFKLFSKPRSDSALPEAAIEDITIPESSEIFWRRLDKDTSNIKEGLFRLLQIIESPYFVATSHLDALSTQDPGEYHYETVRRVLRDEKDEKDEEAIDKLARTLVQESQDNFKLIALRERLQEDIQTALLSPEEEKGMLWLDAWAAEVYEKIGQTGKDIAEQIRTNAPKRWEIWIARRNPEPSAIEVKNLFHLWGGSNENGGNCHFIYLLTKTLWNDKVKPRLEKERRLKSPGLTRSVLNLVNTVHLRKKKRVVEEVDGYRLYTQDLDREREVARIERSKLDEIASRYKCPVVEIDLGEILKATRTLTAQRVLRDLADRGFRQKIAALEDYRTITIVGGITKYTKMIGLDPDKMTSTVRDVLDALELVSIPLPHGGHDGLLVLSNRPPAPKRQAELQIILRDPLLPGYMFALPEKTASQRLERRPVPLPKLLPPLVGSPQFHAAEAALQLLVLREFSEHASDLYHENAIKITNQQWNRLAEEAEVPSRLLPEIKQAWLSGNEGAEPFLSSHRETFYDLGEAYKQERAMIFETGTWVSQSRRRGTASAKKRWLSATKPNKNNK